MAKFRGVEIVKDIRKALDRGQAQFVTKCRQEMEAREQATSRELRKERKRAAAYKTKATAAHERDKASKAHLQQLQTAYSVAEG